MRQEIRNRLKELGEKKYGEFSSGLIPESKPLLGVRLPILRNMAKEMAKGDWRREVEFYEGEYEDFYFEEVMLRGMLIGYGTEKGDLEEGLKYVRAFIPHIDNWSVCDSFCNSFLLAARYRERVWEFLQPYLYSEKEFEVRVAVITLLTQFLKYDKKGKKISRKRVVSMEELKSACGPAEGKETWFPEIKDALNREYPQGYYARMAAAWTAAEAFVVFPGETLALLTQECRMDSWTRNKSLQKICESRIPDEQVKAYIRSLKQTSGGKG